MEFSIFFIPFMWSSSKAFKKLTSVAMFGLEIPSGDLRMLKQNGQWLRLWPHGEVGLSERCQHAERVSWQHLGSFQEPQDQLYPCPPQGLVLWVNKLSFWLLSLSKREFWLIQGVATLPGHLFLVSLVCPGPAAPVWHITQSGCWSPVGV